MLNDPPINNLLNATNTVLTSAINKGLIDNIPEQETLRRLKSDVFVFSACKIHIELKEVSTMLTGEDGKIKPWQKFKDQVMSVHKKYNENYLQSEYIFATSSAEMAARWQQFEKEGDRYNLQYRTAQDDRVRDSHAAMAGITLPVDDPFWNSYFPPNGWRCRCTVVQVSKGKYKESNPEEALKKADVATTDIDSKGRNRGEMFRYNPGKQQVIFPPNHPYFKIKQGIASILNSIAESQSEEVIANQRSELKNWSRDHLVGSTISHPFKEIPAQITFSVKGIKEYLNQPHKNYGAKNRALKNIESLIKNAKYIHSVEDKKGRGYSFHYLKTSIQGEPSYIVLRDDKKEKTVIVYSMVDSIK